MKISYFGDSKALLWVLEMLWLSLLLEEGNDTEASPVFLSPNIYLFPSYTVPLFIYFFLEDTTHYDSPQKYFWRNISTQIAVMVLRKKEYSNFPTKEISISGKVCIIFLEKKFPFQFSCDNFKTNNNRTIIPRRICCVFKPQTVCIEKKHCHHCHYR